MAGVYSSSEEKTIMTLGSQPDNIQGHGLVNLKNMISAYMYVDDLRAVKTGDVISYTYFVETDYVNPILATLVWMDPVVWVSAAKAVLHDLDLSIEVLESGFVYRGNNMIDEDNNGITAPECACTRLNTHAHTGTHY